MSDRARTRRGPHPDRRTSALNPHSSGFAAFSDTIYAGVLIFGLSIPVVTGFAALNAGVRELRESRRDDRHVSARALATAFWAGVRRHPLTQLLLPVVVTALVLVDVVVLPYLAPGEMWAVVLPFVLAAGVSTVALRVAGAWRPELGAGEVFATAWRRMTGDAAGSALLLLAVVTAGALVAIAPLLLVVILGPVALAAVAMDARASAEEAEEVESRP